MVCVKDILDETLSEVLCTDPNYLIPKMLEKLLDNLPLELLSTEPVLDEIGAIACIVTEILILNHFFYAALTIKSSVEGIQLDKDELRKSLEQLPLEAREDVMAILKEILQRVYDTGIDFLYVINQFDA